MMYFVNQKVIPVHVYKEIHYKATTDSLVSCVSANNDVWFSNASFGRVLQTCLCMQRVGCIPIFSSC